jgi:hypothetical protein
MQKLAPAIALLFLTFNLNAQTSNTPYTTLSDSIQLQINGYQRILQNLQGIPAGVTLGGYAEATYNQPTKEDGEMDIQRLVLLFGYKFDERVQFVTEIEYEHVKEVYVEQAFVNYAVSNGLNIRGGLMLVPMGIINEYHEPTTFNGVERPSLDNKLVPTTWREMGLGVAGRIDAWSMRYQAYLFNGFLSYDGSKGTLSGSSGLRGGRQKGAQSTLDHINYSAKFDYYGVPGLRLGLSGYFGKTQAVEEAPELGTIIGVSMIGADFRYNHRKWAARGQWIYANLSDTAVYNQKTGSDLGSALKGYYTEIAYNVLPLANRQRLVTFLRYENFNTHHDVAGALLPNPNFHRKEWTFGWSYHLSQGTVFKVDYQNKATAGNQKQNQFNVGLGVWF